MKKRIFLTLILLFTTLNAVTLQTDKALYNHQNGDSIITVTFGEMQGSSTDWIGIYPAGASYEWENVLAWKLTDGRISGSLTFDLLEAGNYDVRAFFNNTLTKEAEVTVEVIGEPAVAPAVELTTNKTSYLTSEIITVSYNHMLGDTTDWIGVYPAGASYEFENVVAWKSTNGNISGSLTFEDLAAGDYEVRAFFSNTLTKEATYAFSVTTDPNHHDVTVSTDKSDYITSETIHVNFNYMQGSATDWIGVYPAGASYEWENVVSYKVTNGQVQGQVTFDGLPAGSYDVRVFFNNSLTKEVEVSINVTADPAVQEVELTLNKDTYVPNELIFINYDNMQGNATDWIGIYPAGASYEFENVLDWKSTNGNIQGELSLSNIPEGNYEVRAFFNNSLSKEAVKSFSVVNSPVVSTMYEDAENGPSPEWVHIKGNYAPLAVPTPNIAGAPDGDKTLVLVAEGAGSVQYSEYALPMHNTDKKVLEVDIGGLSNYKLPNNGNTGYIIHYSMGVDVQTTKGPRRMRWYSYLNHINVDAHIEGEGDNVWLFYPSPVETTSGYYMPITQWNHFKVNVEKALRDLEPDNRLISIDNYVATGGFFDNIKLSSH